jgi:hypothetical protein
MLLAYRLATGWTVCGRIPVRARVSVPVRFLVQCVPDLSEGLGGQSVLLTSRPF